MKANGTGSLEQSLREIPVQGLRGLQLGDEYIDQTTRKSSVRFQISFPIFQWEDRIHLFNRIYQSFLDEKVRTSLVEIF